MQINKAILGDGWRLLERHETIQDGDQTGRTSLLRSNLNFEDWMPVADFAIGMTVSGALDGDEDARERVFRRRASSVATSDDVERAATLAWNEAVEAALAIVRDNLEWQGPCPTGDAIRALKRTT